MAETTRDGIQLYVHENLFSGYKHISCCAEFPILGTTLGGAQVIGQLSLPLLKVEKFLLLLFLLSWSDINSISGTCVSEGIARKTTCGFSTSAPVRLFRYQVF